MGFLDVPSRGLPAAWAATTHYAAGQFVVAPNGQIASALVDFTSGASFDPTNWRVIASSQEAMATNLLTSGQETVPRWEYSNNLQLNTQVVRGAFFTARKSETINNLKTITSAGAGATPTLCRMGLWRVNADNSMTLVASTANDTTLFAGGNTAFTRATTAPYAIVTGQRYGWGALCVTAASVPSLASTSSVGPAAEYNISPALAFTISAQTDLPASVAANSWATLGQIPYGVMLP